MKLLVQILTYGTALIITVGIFVAADISAKKASAKQENRAAEFASGLPVTVTKVRLVQADKQSVFPGVIRAACETRISPRVSGPLVALNVKPGDIVQKDEVLIQIDPRDFQDNISVLEAQQANAQANLLNAGQDFKRATELFDKKVMPQAEFDRAQTNLSVCRASLDAIKAQLQIARHQLEDTCIKAPYNCVVIRQDIENFEQVSAGQPLLTIQDITTLEIDIAIPENRINDYALTAGFGAIVTLPSIPGHDFKAEMTEWSSSADSLSRTFEVTFSMVRPQEFQLLPGMTASVSLANGQHDGEIIVAASAVKTDLSGSSFVWLYNHQDNTVARTQVVTGGFCGDDSLVIKSGLKADDSIVVQGQQYITEGCKISATVLE